MWIKEIPEELHESGPVGVNFLYRQDKVYIMDNDLCAAWCWLQEIDTGKAYNFVHIDYHYDLSGDEQLVKREVLEKEIQLHKLSFGEFLDLKYPVEKFDIVAKLFRWDNFILNVHDLYPGLFRSTTFITKRGGSKEDFVQYEEEIEAFLDQYEDWLRDMRGGWIIDLDLDFFYWKTRGQYFQLYSDTTVRRLAELLHRNMHKIDVLTIALSPECCGGWENSFKILSIFKEAMGIDFPDINRKG